MSSAAAHPFAENDGKEPESATVTSGVELAEGQVSTQGSTNQIVRIHFHLFFWANAFYTYQMWLIVSHYSALSSPASIDQLTKHNADEVMKPES